jgi:serine/threonine protein kinase
MNKKSKGYLFLNYFNLAERTLKYLEWFKALEFMHDEGVVHLDIKPDNIMATENFDTTNKSNFHIVFIDYGLM